eukprot:1150938-Pelagomonas_calceolata.AAC.2
MKMRSPDEFMCQNSGLQVTFQWPSVDFAGCISQRGVKVRQTALLKCDKMRVKLEFNKVRDSSHGTTLVHTHTPTHRQAHIGAHHTPAHRHAHACTQTSYHGPSCMYR